MIKKFFENNFENIIKKNELLINKKVDNFPSAPPFELADELKADTLSPLKIYPNIEEKICQYCNRTFKNNRGLNIHLRSCKDKI